MKRPARKLLGRVPDRLLRPLHEHLSHEVREREAAQNAGAMALERAAQERQPEPAEVLELPRLYEQARAGLQDLGLETCDGRPIPTLDEITAKLTPAATAFLLQRHEKGIRDELVIAPSLNRLQLSELVRRFDASDKAQTGTVVSEFWDNYAAVEHNGYHDGDGWHSVMLLNDIQPGAEAGLMLAGKNWDEQMKGFVLERQAMGHLGINIQPITIAQLIVADAGRRAANQPLLDETGSHLRFVNYPARKMSFNSENFYTPGARFDPMSGRLELGSVTAEVEPGDRGGIRRVLILGEPNLSGNEEM